MMQKPLISFAALLLFFRPVEAQTPNDPPATAPNAATNAEAQTGEICMPDLRIDARIFIGRPGRQIRLEMTEAAGCPGGHGIEAAKASDNNFSAVVNTERCPAYQSRIDELAKKARTRLYFNKKIPIAPSVFINWSNLPFDLHITNGRREFSLWLRNTLKVTRQCWTYSDDGDGGAIIRTLYANLGMRSR